MDWHPVIVHFPIVLIPLGVVVDLFALMKKREDWHVFAYNLTLAGTVAALVAVLTGNVAAESYREQSNLLAPLESHEDTATLALLLMLAVVLGRMPLQLQQRFEGWPIRAWIGAAVVGSALVWLASLYGGNLVYDYGVGVK